ncbi:uncharacterized protein BCR38DRAFT_450749, partial [Pseudomassariella vexata]
MQGDIFHLDQLALQSKPVAKPAAMKPKASDNDYKKSNTPQVAIYNEDDLSELLYVESMHPADHAGIIMINDVSAHRHSPQPTFEPLTPISTGSHTPLSESNSTSSSSFDLSDCEMESYLFDPPHKHNHHHEEHKVAICGEEVDFPVFLGRQDDGRITSSPRTTHQSTQTTGQETKKAIKFVMPEYHVGAIEGPLMSWWPAPMDLLEHEWIERFY